MGKSPTLSAEAATRVGTWCSMAIIDCSETVCPTQIKLQINEILDTLLSGMDQKAGLSKSSKHTAFMTSLQPVIPLHIQHHFQEVLVSRIADIVFPPCLDGTVSSIDPSKPQLSSHPPPKPPSRRKTQPTLPPAPKDTSIQLPRRSSRGKIPNETLTSPPVITSPSARTEINPTALKAKKAQRIEVGSACWRKSILRWKLRDLYIRDSSKVLA